MGRGNWKPYQNDELFSLRYFDLIERYGVDEMDDIVWDLFREDLMMSLPDSFYEVDSGTVTMKFLKNYSRQLDAFSKEGE